uniref:CSON009913 protein n=1 Tax=Culicoides sonorensis TaxID=179676 RepID=A0A336MYW3_CULSO
MLAKCEYLEKRCLQCSRRQKDLVHEIEKIGTLDAILSGAYCRSQMYLSRQMARLRPELTMPMFSEITHRFQTARAEVRALLLRGLLPWLENMELVATSVPPATPLSYIMARVAAVKDPVQLKPLK